MQSDLFGEEFRKKIIVKKTKRDWERYRDEFSELLNVKDCSILVQKRIGCSIPTFHKTYRKYFVFKFYGKNKGRYAMKLIPFEEANRIIDQIINNPLSEENND